MATSPLGLAQNQVVRDLLHFVSQPLTTLHCALENSLVQGEIASPQDLSLALEETDKIIEAVRLMREYLDSEQGFASEAAIPVAKTVGSVLERVSVLAEARGVRLFAYGETNAVVQMSEARLERAMFYLIGSLIETVPSGGAVVVLLQDAPSPVLSGYSLPTEASPHQKRTAGDFNMLRQTRIAIATCVLGSVGASVEFTSNEHGGFAVHWPQFASSIRQVSA